MNLEDVCASSEVGQTKLNLLPRQPGRETYFSVQTTRSLQGRIQGIGSICCHQNFDISAGIEAIQLVDDLKHCSLGFGVVVLIVVVSETRASNGINFIEKDLFFCLLVGVIIQCKHASFERERRFHEPQRHPHLCICL